LERRIAAIFASDMVGFSKLIEANEATTLKLHKRFRHDVFEPQIINHNGQIIKHTGDGLIAEFGSVIEAVQCAVTIQKEVKARQSTGEPAPISYRIAINLGDIVYDEGDIFGDGVNIAARLEGLAKPGGVVVSGTAYDLLKNNVDVGYKSLGKRKLKNIAVPVRVYSVEEKSGFGTNSVRSQPRHYRTVAWSVFAICLFGMLALFYGPQFAPESEYQNSKDKYVQTAPPTPTLRSHSFSYDGTKNQEVVVAIHSDYGADCKGTIKPSFALFTKPKNGSISYRDGIERVHQPGITCHGKEIPGIEVVYKPYKDFVGTDRFSYNRNSSGGRTLFRVNALINVMD
jgi:class 3 adenylate cyclase